MDLLNFINQKTNNAYEDFKLVSVIFDEKTLELTCKFLYKNELPVDAKEILASNISEYFKTDVIKVIVKCKKAYIDEDLVRDVIYNFIVKNFNSIGLDFEKSRIKVKISDYISVEIHCNEFQEQYILSNSVNQEIITYANSFFFEDFELNIVYDENIASNLADNYESEVLINTYESKEPEYKYHKVEDLKNFIGEVKGYPIQLGSIKGSLEGVEIAGTIKFLTQKSFESKRKDKDGNVIIKDYYSFTLFDKSGRMNCVYFPNKSDCAKSNNLDNDQEVILYGDVDNFNDRISFKVKSIGYCKIIEEEKVEENIVIDENREPFDEYICVKPEPHIEIFQDNLFFEKQEVGKYLLENDVVVFDIETTGLEASRCEIIEIGAVKLSKGKITETFQTLIKPSTHIPEEITDITGINDEMVANSPNIAKVMPDFYKFCYGCTIMAYNIDFDYKFISIFAKKFGYIFSNKQIDVLYLARAFVPGLKNFKLSTVCKKLDVSLENAHRAVNDAMATAEVVIKLSHNLS